MLACDAVPARALRSPNGRPITLKPVRPNAGITAAYNKRLRGLIEEMHRSVLYWLKAAYRAAPPAMAQDAPDGGYGRGPAHGLIEEMEGLGVRWTARFEEAAPRLADYFAQSVTNRAEGALAGILRDAGFTVKFQATPAARDIFQATLAEQVGLIKNIGTEYLADVQGAVLRSVQAGRDLGSLATEIEGRYGVTKRRAALIARDQNNKATATLTRARQSELGITKAIWVHSAGGRKPRASHVAANGKTYDVAAGMKIDGEFIWPGQLVNCRCVSRSVVEGFD